MVGQGDALLIDQAAQIAAFSYAITAGVNPRIMF